VFAAIAAPLLLIASGNILAAWSAQDQICADPPVKAGCSSADNEADIKKAYASRMIPGFALVMVLRALAAQRVGRQVEGIMPSPP
jgi:hypothetical protein